MIRVIVFLTAEAGLLAGGITAGSAMLGDINLWIGGAIAFALLTISGAVYWRVESVEKRDRKEQDAKIDKVLKAQGRQAHELRAFMNKSHSWSLDGTGRAAAIPEGCKLIETNDGNYLIAEPVRMSGRAGITGIGGSSPRSGTKKDDD